MPYANRGSNALRASVLDAFIELGAFDSNGVVADWIFSDPAQSSMENGASNPRPTIRWTEDRRKQWTEPEGGDTVDGESGTIAPFRFKPSKFFLWTKPKSKSNSQSEPSSDLHRFNPDNRNHSSSPKDGSLTQSLFRFKIKSSKANLRKTAREEASVITPMSKPEGKSPLSSPNSKSKSRPIMLWTKPKPPTDSQTPGNDEWEDVLPFTTTAFQSPSSSADHTHPSSSLILDQQNVYSQPSQVDLSSNHETNDLHVSRDDGDNGRTIGPNRSPKNSSFAIHRSMFKVGTSKRLGTIPRALVPLPVLHTRSTPNSPIDSRFHSHVRSSSSVPSSPFILVAPVPPSTQNPFVPQVKKLPIRQRFSVASLSKTLRGNVLSYDASMSNYSLPSASYSSLPAVVSAPAQLQPLAPTSHLFNQPIPSIKRGRDAPFPSRPILPFPLSRTRSNDPVATDL